MTDDRRADLLKLWNFHMEADQKVPGGEFTSTKNWLDSLTPEEHDYLHDVMLHFTYMALQRGKAMGRAIRERNASGREITTGALNSAAGNASHEDEDAAKAQEPAHEEDPERDAVARRLLRDVFGG